MPPCILIYATDTIRGAILLKTLQRENIDTVLCSTDFEAKEKAAKKIPDVIIFDTKIDPKRTFWDELKFLKTLSHGLPETTKIILSDPQNIAAIKTAGIQNYLCSPDPLDPEGVLSIVKNILDTKIKKSTLTHCLGLLYTIITVGRKLLLRSLPAALTLFIGAVGGYVYWCFVTLPELETIEDYYPYEASELYSYDNELLTEFYIEKRISIPHHMIPQHVKNAFIAVEDKRFYNHCGIDFIRIIGALIQDIKAMKFVEGGSTITQQLAKMIFLSPEKNITRKLKEIALAIQLERKYAKNEILGLYLNHAYFGTRAYGIETAAQTYFGKATENITIPEAALLATLPRAPSKYSPFKNSEKAVNRRDAALGKMRRLGFINKFQYQEAIAEPLPEKRHERKNKAPYFISYLRGILENKFGDRLYTSGLKIYTTLDYQVQKAAEAAVKKGIEKLKMRGVEGVQAALVAVEAKTGRIKAMVGGTNYEKSKFNRVTQAKRQPGSAFKPLVYLTALNQGYTPDDIIDDEKFTYIRQEGIWVPQNYDHVYHGKVTLQSALTRSLNAATVNLANKIGIANIIKTAKKLGIRSIIHPYTSSALGASELTLLELVNAYAALKHGYRIEAVSIDRIIDRRQQSLMVPSNHRERIIDKAAVADMRKMLRAVILEGTARKAGVFKRKTYGKTGTTNDYADAWFIGFDDTIIAGVWVGRDDRTSIGNNETGATAALPIWVEFMHNIDSPNGSIKPHRLWSKAAG